jgi:hypothetical protein
MTAERSRRKRVMPRANHAFQGLFGPRLGRDMTPVEEWA